MRWVSSHTAVPRRARSRPWAASRRARRCRARRGATPTAFAAFGMNRVFSTGHTSCGPATVATSASTFFVAISRREGLQVADAPQEEALSADTGRVASWKPSICACSASRWRSAPLRGRGRHDRVEARPEALGRHAGAREPRCSTNARARGRRGSALRGGAGNFGGWCCGDERRAARGARGADSTTFGGCGSWSAPRRAGERAAAEREHSRTTARRAQLSTQSSATRSTAPRSLCRRRRPADGFNARIPRRLISAPPLHHRLAARRPAAGRPPLVGAAERGLRMVFTPEYPATVTDGADS